MEKFLDWIKSILGKGEIEREESSDKWNTEEIKVGVSENQDTEPQEVMEEARVRCTCCKEQVSEVFVYKRKDKNVEYSGEKNPLNHKDTVFKDKFAGCINTEDGKCEIEILEGIWFEPNEDTKIGDGYEVDEENSYMICQKGYGMIYITDSGQVRGGYGGKIRG